MRIASSDGQRKAPSNPLRYFLKLHAGSNCDRFEHVRRCSVGCCVGRLKMIMQSKGKEFGGGCSVGLDVLLIARGSYQVAHSPAVMDCASACLTNIQSSTMARKLYYRIVVSAWFFPKGSKLYARKEESI